MDISSVIKTVSVAPLAAKTGDTVKSGKPETNGNTSPIVDTVQTAEFGFPQSDPVAASKPAVQELQSLVEQVNTELQGRDSNLKFSIDEGTDISVVRIEDTETGELIRQVPSEAMVAIAKAISEAQQGMMLEDKA